ncbi:MULTISPECIES: hypothetical protein [Streptomyces]|uniref:Uncharacterized protein n=1 Tax=Streptomyces galilaeus TaxID=33899 RepID=A0ABW9ILV6_STRGJ
MTDRRGGGPTAALDPAGPEPTDPGGPGTVPSGSGRRILAARGDGSPRSGQEVARGHLAAATDDDTTTHRTTGGSPRPGAAVPPTCGAADPPGSGRPILAARGDGSPRSGQEAASGRLAAATDDDTTTHRTTSGSPQLGIVVHPGSGVHPRAAGAHPSSPARQDGASGCETDTR